MVTHKKIKRKDAKTQRRKVSICFLCAFAPLRLCVLFFVFVLNFLRSKFSFSFLGLFLFLLLFTCVPFALFALTDVSVNASMDPSTLQQGWPIKGMVEITHYADQKVDETSFRMEGKPIKIHLLRSVKISPKSSLTVAIYQFTLPPQERGSYTLSPINVKVGSRTYQTLPVSYEVQGPITLPPTGPGDFQESSLKLEAYIDGPKELYPGQTTKLVYRYVYQGNIELSKEVLPMLEAEGLQKIGRNEIVNKTEKNKSIFEIFQEVQAVKPGTYSWGPSTIEGVVYVEDTLGNKQFTSTKLTSEAPPVQLIVKAFPLEGKPASFNGAFGEFTFDVKLLSPPKISVGDRISLDIAISGKTSNWDSVSLPELCCQPGFGGFFKLGDLPPVGKMGGDSKHFDVEMNPLTSSIKSIPTIQFSYFEPKSGQYKILYSTPLSISVSPIQDIAIAQAEKNSSEQKSYKSEETAADWLQFYKTLPVLDVDALMPLKTADLRNKLLASWWILWLIPISIILLVLQVKSKEFLKKRTFLAKIKTSREFYAEMLKAPAASPLFFQLLRECFMQGLFEKGKINSIDIAVETLPSTGIVGEVRSFLMHIDSLRYTSSIADDILYEQTLEESKRLYKKLQDVQHA